MTWGLSPQVIKKICNVFEKFPEIKKAILYGSRAKGNFKTGSDIDLTLVGPITNKTMSQVSDTLDDLLLPYTIDLSVLVDITHESLREHIARVGVVFYLREKNE